VRAWAAEPGEHCHGFEAAYGGLWRNQGRAPKRLAGVGFAAQGGDVSSDYRRRSDSFKPKVAFVFEGVGRDERIGDFGLVGGGAAGLELDGVSQKLGTPANTDLLASSENHTDNYQLALEEILQPGPGRGGREHPRVRADMVFVDTGGGAVFSVGSIAWAGRLPHNGYKNNVVRITGNVLRRFLDPKPL